MITMTIDIASVFLGLFLGCVLILFIDWLVGR